MVEVRGREDREAWKDAEDICGAAGAATAAAGVAAGAGWADSAGKSASLLPLAACEQESDDE